MKFNYWTEKNMGTTNFLCLFDKSLYPLLYCIAVFVLIWPKLCICDDTIGKIKLMTKFDEVIVFCS